MKALEKDRNRRYETANGLARDLERYLDDEPVQACPPSARYRLSKFARRHRTALATAGLFALLLIGGAAVSTYSAIRARQAEAETKRALAEAKDAQAKTDQALKESEGSRSQAEAVSRFLVEAFRKPDPARDGSKVTVAEVLDQAVSKLQDQFAGSPRIQGELLQALVRLTTAWAFTTERSRPTSWRCPCAARRWDRPRRHARQPQRPRQGSCNGGPDFRCDPFVRAGLETQRGQAGSLPPGHAHQPQRARRGVRRAGRTAEAIRMHEQTLELCEANLGHDHPLTQSANAQSYAGLLRRKRVRKGPSLLS